MHVTACLLAAMLGVASSTADAQESPRPGDVGEDLVVTAQRREERAQTVPVAITALSAQRIEDDAIANLDRIGADVPNLYLSRNFGTTSGALVFLRGVGEGDSIFTNDPPVGIYVDDVILPRSTGALLDLLDVERIEVLRGPQGTLYGRNTSGGAIKLVSRRPRFDGVEGVADVALGSYRRFDARGTLNLPLSSSAALRVSALSRNQRGWGRNLTDAAHVNGQDVQAGRTSLLWEPASTVSVFATADLTLDRSGPRFPQRFVPDPAAPGRFLNRFQSVGGSLDNFVSADLDPIGRTDTGGGSVRIDYRTGPTTASSITAYRALHSLIGFDQTASPPGVGANVILLQDQHQHSVSQEFQLAGMSPGETLTWLAGLYYFDEYNKQLTAVSFATPAGSPNARFRTHDFFEAPSRAGGNWSPYEPSLATRSLSGYASGTYALGEATRVTAGLRYTDETKRYSVRFLSAPDTVLLLPDGRPAARTIRRRFTDVSPRFVLDRRIGGTLVYASVAKGFRSGSFDGRARNVEFALTRQDVIAPETVWSWEAGAKADLLSGRLRVNATYFLNNYTDIAFSAARANSTPPEIFRQNVGDARLHGIEVEWTATPLAGIDLGGWVSTLSDRFTRLRSVIGCAGVVERDLDLRFTPAFRYQVRAGVTQSVGAARVRVGGDYSDASPYNIALCNEPQHRVSDAGAMNLQLGVEVGDWGATLSATNLTDNRYNSGSVGTIGYPVAPREITLRLRRRI